MAGGGRILPLENVAVRHVESVQDGLTMPSIAEEGRVSIDPHVITMKRMHYGIIIVLAGKCHGQQEDTGCTTQHDIR